MRIVVIGASGTIGKAVVAALAAGNEVVAVGKSSGDFRVDLGSKPSIEALFKSLGRIDAVVSAAGEARFGPLDALSDDDFAVSLGNKLMGQVNLVRVGHPFVADGGSLTLTSGVLAQRPMPGGAAISLVNAGLEGFARAAALELPRGIRVNVVSPPWISETMRAMGMDPTGGNPAAHAARAYVAAVSGTGTGEVIDGAAFA